MPILNYTTKIDPEKTGGEIQRMLARAGASQVLTEFDNGSLSAISFRLMHNDVMVTFRLPAQVDRIYVILQNDKKVERRYRNREQAARTGWRIIKDWIEAQLAIVEADQAEMVEVFLPYAQNPSTGETMFQMMENSDMFLLSPPKENSNVRGTS